jgi:non-ribosomal peptide synthase protein (TIGR01720 family)
VIVHLDQLPLNQNGKVDRARLPAPSVQTSTVTAGTPTEQALADLWADALDLPGVGIHDNFFDLGGDSILSIRIASQARQAGLTVTSAQIFEHQTIHELAAAIDQHISAPAADQDVVTGAVPLTPIQRWFLAVDGAQDRFNQSKLLQWHGHAEPVLLRRAFAALVAHHDALRLRLTPGPDGDWQQHIAEAESADLLHLVDLTGTPAGDRDEAMRVAANKVQASLSLEHGPLLRAALVRFDPGQNDRLLIVVHHLAVDLVSWDFLLADLAAVYAGDALQPKTVSFKSWAELLTERANSRDHALHVRYWQELAAPVAALPTDHQPGSDTEADTRMMRCSLTTAETTALTRAARAVGAGSNGVRAVLLAALARTLGGWAGGEAITVDLESHGRADLADVSRTVGWFTALYPMRLRTAITVAEVDEQLRAVPQQGIDYGVARHLSASGGVAPSTAEVSFNYLGQRSAGVGPSAQAGAAPFTVLAESAGDEVDPAWRRPYLLDVAAWLSGGRLEIMWVFSIARYERDTIRNLTERYLDELRRLSRPAGREPGASWQSRLFPGTPLLAVPMARYHVPGVSIAVIRDRTVEAWGHGVAAAGASAQVGAGTLFPVGSVSKHVTALAVLRLAEKGVLDLDADVNTYLRQWSLPGLDPDHPVTLRRLLNHTAGLVLTPVVTYRRDEQRPTLLDVLHGRPPALTEPIRGAYRPGSRYDYSGNNYAVVEQVVVDVTGMPFADAAATLVLDPLRMRDSSFAPTFAEQRGDVARGHSATGRPIDGGWRHGALPAAGGLWSTPSDLARLVLGSAQTPGTLAQLCGGLGNGYGLGTVVKTVDGSLWFGHPGDSNGYRSYVGFNAQDGTGLVLAANGDGATALFQELFGRLGVDLDMPVQGPGMAWDEQEWMRA